MPVARCGWCDARRPSDPRSALHGTCTNHVDRMPRLQPGRRTKLTRLFLEGRGFDRDGPTGKMCVPILELSTRQPHEKPNIQKRQPHEKPNIQKILKYLSLGPSGQLHIQEHDTKTFCLVRPVTNLIDHGLMIGGHYSRLESRDHAHNQKT